MFRNLKLFKMLGVDVFLNTSWFLVFLIAFTWSNITIESFITELLTVVFAFVSILLHEFGHVLMARRFSVRTDKIVLNILGGAAFINQQDNEKLTPKQNILVYLAGPFVNLCLFIILFIVSILLKDFDIMSRIIYVVSLLNVIFFIFNMLPIFPMDGGGILRNILLYFNVKNAIRISAYISVVLSIALFIVMVLLGSITGCIISILLLLTAIPETKK